MGRAEFFPLVLRPTLHLWLLERGLTLIGREQEGPYPHDEAGTVILRQTYEARSSDETPLDSETILEDLARDLSGDQRVTVRSVNYRQGLAGVTEARIRIDVETSARGPWAC